jgi:hypothetical protein
MKRRRKNASRTEAKEHPADPNKPRRTVVPAFARPRFGKIHTAQAYFGMGRSKLYELGAKHEGLFRKLDKVTVVDFDMLNEIMSGLPLANIKPPPDSQTA